jgi:hypothetical protein
MSCGLEEWKSLWNNSKRCHAIVEPMEASNLRTRRLCGTNVVSTQYRNWDEVICLRSETPGLLSMDPFLF